MSSAGALVTLHSQTSSRRPQPIPHAAIAPPFDQSDQYGQVHTTLPPEQVIPPHFTDPLFMRADFGGVTFAGDYTPTQSADIIRNGGVTFTSGRYAGKFFPFLQGANTTPASMTMSPMALMYPQEWQDAILTEHAERGYDDFVIAPDGWNMAENGYNNSPANIKAWAQYVKQTWGFRIVYWQGDYRQGLNDTFHALYDADLINFYIFGKEVDAMPGGSKEEYEAALNNVDAIIRGLIPIGVHFTANGSDHNYGMGWPIGWSRDTYMNDWGPYNGRVHLMQQMGCWSDPAHTGLMSAGKQGASMWYARQAINCAEGDGAWGPGAPDSVAIAFETMAESQLYGRCSEEYGCLRNWELLSGTRNASCSMARPVSGFGSGCRYPDGRPI